MKRVEKVWYAFLCTKVRSRQYDSPYMKQRGPGCADHHLNTCDRYFFKKNNNIYSFFFCGTKEIKRVFKLTASCLKPGLPGQVAVERIWPLTYILVIVFRRTPSFCKRVHVLFNNVSRLFKRKGGVDNTKIHKVKK